MELMLESLIQAARDDPRVLAVILYGSAARGEMRPTSDQDVCVVLQPGLDPATEGMQTQLDYLRFHELDVRIYQRLPIYVRQRVLKEGNVLHVKDEDQLYEIAFRTIRAFEDFRPFYLAYLEEVVNG
jgi:uncharacterized protein